MKLLIKLSIKLFCLTAVFLPAACGYKDDLRLPTNNDGQAAFFVDGFPSDSFVFGVDNSLSDSFISGVDDSPSDSSSGLSPGNSQFRKKR